MRDFYSQKSVIPIWKGTKWSNKCFFSHHFLATLMTNQAQIFTGLLCYACVGIHQVGRLIFANYQRCTFPFKSNKNLQFSTSTTLQINNRSIKKASFQKTSHTLPHKQNTQKKKVGPRTKLIKRSGIAGEMQRPKNLFPSTAYNNRTCT